MSEPSSLSLEVNNPRILKKQEAVDVNAIYHGS